MQAMFREVTRVLKVGARAAFVIGDATVDGSEGTTTDDMADWAKAAGLRLERRIPKIVYGLYSIMKDETDSHLPKTIVRSADHADRYTEPRRDCGA